MIIASYNHIQRMFFPLFVSAFLFLRLNSLRQRLQTSTVVMPLSNAEGGALKVLSVDSIAVNWQQWEDLLLRLSEAREVRSTLLHTKKKGKRALSVVDAKALEQMDNIILNLRFQGHRLRPRRGTYGPSATIHAS